MNPFKRKGPSPTEQRLAEIDQLLPHILRRVSNLEAEMKQHNADIAALDMVVTNLETQVELLKEKKTTLYNVPWWGNGGK